MLDRGWSYSLGGAMNTVLLDAPGQLLITFTQPATREFPFMFQCHILEHEDGGMMGSTSRSDALA